MDDKKEIESSIEKGKSSDRENASSGEEKHFDSIQDNEKSSEDGGKPTSKKKPLIIAIVVIVLCVAGVAGYCGIMNTKAAEVAAYENHSVAEIKKAANDSGFSMTLKPADRSLFDAMGNEDLWKVTGVETDIWSRRADVSIEPTPSATVDAFLRFVKSQNQETMKLIYEGETYDLTQAAWSSESSSDDSLREEIEKMREEGIYPKMLDFDYTISGEDVNDSNATVAVDISTYSIGSTFNNAISNFMSQGMSLALSGASNEQLNSLLIGLIKNEFDTLSSKEYEKTTELSLHWNGTTWIVNEIARSDDFTNVATGGLRQVADTIQEAY